LAGCCADYGLLETGLRSNRRILPFRITQPVSVFLAYDLHLRGIADNSLLAHEDWGLFGLSRDDVVQELKRLSRQGDLVIQAAGDVVRISWTYKDMETVCNVLAQG